PSRLRDQPAGDDIAGIHGRNCSEAAVSSRRPSPAGNSCRSAFSGGARVSLIASTARSNPPIKRLTIAGAQATTQPSDQMAKTRTRPIEATDTQRTILIALAEGWRLRLAHHHGWCLFQAGRARPFAQLKMRTIDT